MPPARNTACAVFAIDSEVEVETGYQTLVQRLGVEFAATQLKPQALSGEHQKQWT